MKKLLLLLIIPFLSFGQCEDESACNYGMTAEDFIDGAFTGECEYVGDYCFLRDVFWNDNNYWTWCGWNAEMSAWNENCECVAIEHEDCSPDSGNNGCPVLLYDNAIIPILVPDSINCDDSVFGGPSVISTACLEPGDSCLFGYSRNPFVSSPLDSIGNFFPIDILEASFTNFPYDWLVVTYFNSIINENCECECVSGDYVRIENASFGWTPYSNYDMPLEQFYYDCNSLGTNLNPLFNEPVLITTIDILGRETTNKGFQLHIYDDGTVEKKYLIK